MAGRSRRTALGLAAVAATLATAAPASAAELLGESVSVDGPVVRSCVDRPGGDGAVQRSVTAPASGWLTARLRAAEGDWDVAVFDAQSGDQLGGGASPGSQELAEVFVVDAQQLTVQACRLSGEAARAQLDVESVAVKPPAGDFRPSVVAVSTPNKGRKDQLLGLGLDVTEHGGPGFIAVVLRSVQDAQVLRKNGFVYKTLVADLVGQTIADRAAERRWARSVRASNLPSGRETYRTLADYETEMKTLAQENPTLVKPIQLPFKTWTGRTVQGIEITTDVNARDGKPVFLQMGAHHAREWPSAEHAMEWAYELINGYKAGNGRVRGLMHSTRTIVIPVVNPDGFNASRSAGGASANGREGVETANLAIPYEYHRKNCRTTNPSGDDPESGNCTQQPATGISQFGTDPNRNYGGFWGGPGASAPGGEPPGDYNQDYRGNGPFSEPETQNVRDLVSKRHVTTLITNHTASNLVLRPPGLQSLGLTPDENRGYKALGDAMAAENGYTSQYSWQLYDTSGTTEDWTYFATGGYGFTFEIGCEDKDEESQECLDFHFHPSYQKVVAEYEGTTVEADENGRDGLGNREAYFKAQQNTADAAQHSVLGGRAPGGAVLRLAKSFDTPTSRVLDPEGREGERQFFRDNLDTSMEVPGSSSFEWHVNPSTRPLHMEQIGRPSTGPASDPIQFSGNLVLPDGAAACGNFDTENEACWNDHAFEVPSDPSRDNGRFTVRIDWHEPGSDWDMKVFVDSDGDGSSVGETEMVGSSAQFATSWEQATVSEPVVAPGKKFVARVINFAAADPYEGEISFHQPEFFEKRTESWRLTCESHSGTVLTSQEVTINRGERQDPGLQRCITAFQRAFASGRGCDRPTGRVFRKGLDRARLGRDRNDHLRRYRIGLRGRRNLDKFCLSDRRVVRIGYPTDRVLRQNLGRSRGGFAPSKAVLVLTSSRRFRLRRVRVGMRPALMRSRIGRRIRPIRIGANRWYLRRGRGARLVFKVRAGRVREVGHAPLRLTNTRRKSARLLRSFPLR